MSRGRKTSLNIGESDRTRIFYNVVGCYMQIINKELGKYYPVEPLSHHIKITGGFAFKTAFYKDNGIPIIRISDFSNEKIVLDEVVYYEELSELKKYELVENDIIIALTGGTIAKLAIVQKGLGKLYLNQRVGKFGVLKPEEFEQEYVYWIARSVQTTIKSLAWGAAIPNVSPKDIEELRFPFPPKEVQRAIIEFLHDLKDNELKSNFVYFNGRVEEQIQTLFDNHLLGHQISSELQTQLSLVKQLRQAFLREAMEGKLCDNSATDETGQQLLEKIKAEKEALVKEKKIKKEKPLPPIESDEIPFEIPENWVWCRLKDICRITGGGTPSMNNDEYWNGNIPWISPKDMKSLIVEDSELKITPKGIEGSSANLIPPGSLLVVGRSGILKRKLPVAINTVECSVNQDMKVLVPYERTMNRFLQYLLLGLERVVLTNYVKFGMTVHSLKYQEFEVMPIPLPPLDIQTKLVERLDYLTSLCKDLAESIKKAQQQNEQLLQQVLKEALEAKEEVEV